MVQRLVVDQMLGRHPGEVGLELQRWLLVAAAQQAQFVVEQEQDVDSSLAEGFDSSEQPGRMCLQHGYLAGVLEPMWAEQKAADFAAEEELL